jgi:hypothetical protein
MSRNARSVSRLIRQLVGVAAIAGACCLFWYAASEMPDMSDHHGDALDGLDGLGVFFGLLLGGGGLVLLGLGAVLVLPRRRRAR